MVSSAGEESEAASETVSEVSETSFGVCVEELSDSEAVLFPHAVRPRRSSMPTADAIILLIKKSLLCYNAFTACGFLRKSGRRKPHCVCQVKSDAKGHPKS